MGKELELTSSSYALKVNAKEATELHYGCPVEGRWNICLCDESGSILIFSIRFT